MAGVDKAISKVKRVLPGTGSRATSEPPSETETNDGCKAVEEEQNKSGSFLPGDQLHELPS